jgi:hypothetical protein
MTAMRTCLPIVLTLAAVTPATAGGPPPGPSPTQASRVPCVVAVSALEAPQTRTDRPPVFRASVVQDLRLDVSFSKQMQKGFETGDHVVEMRVYTPRGRLYQSLMVPFSADGGHTAKLDGYPRAVQVQSLHVAPSVGAAFPVAGTSIVQSSIYGDWRVEVHVDGAATRCGAPAVFTVQP